MNKHDDLAALLGIDLQAPDSELRSRLAESDDRFLEQLVCLRKSKGLTQTQVAARMGRDKSAVSNFERLGADPHLSTIRRYAAAIRASVDHLVADTEHSEPPPHCADSLDEAGSNWSVFTSDLVVYTPVGRNSGLLSRDRSEEHASWDTGDFACYAVVDVDR